MGMGAVEDLFAGGGEMGALMRSLDWSQTLLGSVSEWAQSLKTALSIILTSRYPMFIWWGAEYANLYNDAYRPILGATKHPQFLGQSAKDCWADVWDVVGPLADSVLTTGQPTWSEDLLLLMDRNGYLEETYFTFSYSPVRDESGGVGGVFCAVTETTGQIIGERRLRTLRELAAKTAEAKTVEEACHIVTKTLSINPYDIAFALVYQVEPDGKQACLVGTTGIEPGTIASPEQVELSHESESDRWNLARVNRTGQAEFVSDLPTRFSALPKGAWSEEPTEALVIPIAQSGKTQQCGLLVIGISPRREFDDDYQGFFDLIASNVATAIANADAYEAERKRATALAELDRAKTTFFSNISHEFRTPLTLMLGSVEETLAGNEPLSTYQREQLEVAQRNSLRLLKLVNTLLDFSRIEAGRIQAVYEPTDLATFTRELASVFRSAIERAGMQLVVDCPPLPEPIYVDREMWEKIVFNLLSNAFKFTFEGTITVELRSCTDHVELDVSDTGIGIPENELPRLFERFHRVPGARGRTYEGSGIGLSLVQELVRLHGGTLRVASVEGQGSCFTVSIPAGFVHLPQDRIDATQTLTSTATQAAAYVEDARRWLPEEGNREWGIGNREVEEPLITNNQSLTIDNPTPDSRLPTPDPARILLVDDNADMRDYVRRLLSREYEVEAVSDGLAALDAVQRHPPDLVLTDVMMPRLDGLGLLRSLRNDPATQNIPIILLSARAGEESRIEGLEAGANDYLIKPFSARELLARVRTNLELARLRRESVRSEIALRRSEERLKLAQQAAGAGLWDWDIVTDRVTWSEDYYQLYGLNPATTPSYENWIASIWEPDREQADRAAREALEHRTNLNVEFRVFQPIQGLRWLVALGQTFYDANGKPIRMTGIALDISDRKQAEVALRQSEEQARLAIKVGRLGTWRYNLHTDLVELDKRMREIWGEPDDAEIIPLPGVMERIHRDDRERVAIAIGAALDPGSSGMYEIDYRIVWDDGTQRWVSANGQVQFEGEGECRQPINFFGTTLDITDRKQAEEALRESESRFRNIADHSPIMIWISAPDGAGVWFNQQWCEFTGQTLLEALGSGWLAAVHPEDAQSIEATCLQAHQRHEPVCLEYRLRRQDGEYRWVFDSAVPRFDDTGVYLGYIGSIIDITDRKQAEAEREQLLVREQVAREQAETANRIKDEFLAVLSHELRSPLNPILGWAKLLQSRTFDEHKTKHALATIERNAKLQTQLIEDLLDVSRILRGKLILNTAPVNLASTIEAALETVRLAADAKGIQIQRVLDPNAEQVMGESARLQQVIWNLLSNAVKFTPSGGTIEIRLEQIHKLAQLQVKDSGKGIAPEFLPHVFEYFRQADSTTTRKFGGLGLGLAIVRHLVELHGGTIWAESRGEGLGATFTVRLPLMPVPTPTPQDNPPEAPVAHLTGLQILVVDDEPDIRDIVAFILEQAGATVRVATCAPEALNLMAQPLPDVLICDIGMPDIDGYMLMRLLRTLPPSKGGKIPAIALTAYAGEVDQQQALAAGFQQHIAKPVEPEELVRAIAALVHR